MFRRYETKGIKTALEWDDLVLQEEFKSLMYVDRLLRGAPKKDKLMDKLIFKDCMRFKKNTSRKFFGITAKGRKFIIHAGYFDANSIFSHWFLHNLKHRPNVVQDLSTL